MNTVKRTIAALLLAASMLLVGAVPAEAAYVARTTTFWTVTKQMGRDYCWNLYGGRVISVHYAGRGYYANTCRYYVRTTSAV